VAFPPVARPAPATGLAALTLLPPSVGTVVEVPAVETPPVPTPPVVAALPDAPGPAGDPAAMPESSQDEPATSEQPAGEKTPTGEPEAPKLKHVFLITLSDQPASRTYTADSPAPYLAKTLTERGVLLANHHAVTRGGLANTIAMLSGQGPTPETQAGCPTYADVAPRSPEEAEGPGEDGQQLGAGCVYSPETGTLVDQLRGSDRDWAAYVEGMAAGSATTPTVPAACRRPALGTADDTAVGRPNDPYATARNPFAYFHSLVDDPKAREQRDKGPRDPRGGRQGRERRVPRPRLHRAGSAALGHRHPVRAGPTRRRAPRRRRVPEGMGPADPEVQGLPLDEVLKAPGPLAPRTDVRRDVNGPEHPATSTDLNSPSSGRGPAKTAVGRAGRQAGNCSPATRSPRRPIRVLGARFRLLAAQSERAGSPRSRVRRESSPSMWTHRAGMLSTWTSGYAT